MGSAPYVGGGFRHFYVYAPDKLEYPIDRFAMETKRQLDVLDRQLAERRYIAGERYSIADIAIWPWYGGLAQGALYDAAEFLGVQDYRNLRQRADEIAARPAVRRGRKVNRVWGDEADQVPSGTRRATLADRPAQGRPRAALGAARRDAAPPGRAAVLGLFLRLDMDADDRLAQLAAQRPRCGRRSRCEACIIPSRPPRGGSRRTRPSRRAACARRGSRWRLRRWP